MTALLARVARPAVILPLFVLILAIAHGARDAVFVGRWWDEFRAGRLSLGAMGRDDVHEFWLTREENLLYLPGFRDVADGHVLTGDDYLYESKRGLSPAPLIPKLIGGAVLALTGGETGWTVALLRLMQAVSYVVLYAALRAASLPPLPAAAVVTALLVLAQGWLSPSLPAKALLFDRIGTALTLGTPRFIAPILTLPFFLAFLIPLFRDPSLSRRRTAVTVGLLAGVNAYVYYANIFVIGVFLPVYLALLTVLWPEHRRHHVTAAAVAALVTAPLLVLVVAAQASLPADYIARAGTSQYGRGRHLASLNPRVIVTFAVLYTLLPIVAVIVTARRSGGAAPGAPGLLARVRHRANAVRGTAGSALVLLAGLGFVASVVPSLLQLVVDLPQPSRIYMRVGATCSVVTLGVLVWLVASRWAPAHHPRGRRVLSVTVGFALAAVVGHQVSVGWTSSTAPYAVAAAHAAVVDAVRGRAWPCVVSSSSAVLAAFITSRTRCDSLAPNILLSSVSEAEAVDRHVASWVLEHRPLDEVLAYFRLRAVPAGEDRRVVCAVGGEGLDRQGWYTDGLSLTHHLAPCRPARVRAAIVAAYERYMARPAEILGRYRVDAVYSQSGALHPALSGTFRRGTVPGLFEREGAPAAPAGR